jgi:hypothetical protein
MSIQRSIQTGVMIGQALQTTALRQQVAQMQELELARQQQEDAVASYRQLVFNARKVLDEAEQVLVHDPLGACYSISLACLNLGRINDSIFPDFHEKEVLYQNQRRGAQLLSHIQASLAPDAFQHLYRLAWLDEVRIGLRRLITWLKIREKVDAAAFFFTPSPGLFRGILLFFGGNIVGGSVAAVLFSIAHPLGTIVYLSCNGITLLIADTIIRNKIIRDCHAVAQQIGGWVGKGLSRKSARVMVEQAREHLKLWDYSSTANSSAAARQELAKVEEEVRRLSDAYFPMEASPV